MNTINNVPRELLENTLNKMSIVWQSTDEMDQLRALLSAPSPAGVDGLEVALSSEQILEVFERNGFRIELGASFSARGQIAQLLNAVGEIDRLSDAQAIIDGLRGDVARLDRESQNLSDQLGACGRDRNMFRTERDQQAKRIGELDGLLRDVAGMFRGPGIEGGPLTKLRRRIAAALSAGKDSAS